MPEQPEGTCCGKPLRFDPLLRGFTCGGLELEGWDVCDVCGKGWIAKRSKPAERWKLNGGGRSIDAHGTRLRAEASGDVQGLMQRIVRLPDLERALAAIAAGAPDPVTLAKNALAPGDPS